VDTAQDLTPQPPEPTLADELRAARQAQDRTPEQQLVAEMAAGLRAMAEMIEHKPQVAELLRSALTPGNVLAPLMHEPDPVAAAAEVINATVWHGARVVNSVDETYFNADASWGPAGFRAYANREQVCLPVTSTVEVTTWVCRPTLAAAIDEAGV
jgi:hypothetical protein